MSVRAKTDPRLRDMAALDALFLEAAETERKLPPAIRKQKMSSWVEYVKTWESYGWHDFTPSLPKATPEQVTRFEKFIQENDAKRNIQQHQDATREHRR